MATCKRCNATIPNGAEYCSNCLDEEMLKNESYLDSLLNSVQNSSPDVDGIYKRKNADKAEDKEKAPAEDNEQESVKDESDDYVDYTVDMEDFEDLFETLDMDDSLHTGEQGDTEDIDAKDASDNMTEAGLWQKEEADALEAGSVMDASDAEEIQEEDIFRLLNEIPSDDPISEEARAISELLSGQSDIADEPPTVKEVFSDTLKVVNSLDDPEEENAAISDMQAEAVNKAENKKLKKALKKAKRKERKEKKAQERIEKRARKAKDKKESQQQESWPEADEEQPVTEQSKQAKKGILRRLFGNVHDEKAAAKKKEMQQQVTDDRSGAKEKEKRSLFARLFKRKNDVGSTEEDELESVGNRRVANAERRRNAKEDKKEKKRKRKEIIEVIDEIEEDEGRINRVGASIVFCFFGILALVLFFGTEKVTYSLSIRHATDYFERQKYNEAYNEISGIEPKDEDREIYDRIMTVMYVNKQLNSYNNYYYLGMYPQALDSLLKGIERYDKYIEYATMLGIKSDLDYVKGQILAELENVFNLTENEIERLMDIKDAYEYSHKIHEIAQERIND